MKKYDNIVFVGRFQPFHNGHKSVIDYALTLSERVTVVIGSHESPPNTRNPFSSNVRAEMIFRSYPELQGLGRIICMPQVDHVYNFDKWVASVQAIGMSGCGWKAGPMKIGIIGNEKDESSFYLKSFPNWDRIIHPLKSSLDATPIREDFFSMPYSAFAEKWKDSLPSGTFAILSQFKSNYAQIADEFKFISDYKRQWAASPYPPTFVTVDACVVQSGHILLVKRRAEPGRGLYALPGGFLNNKEFIDDAVIRELREETRIAVPSPVLKGSVVKKEVFDDPWRSQRGRTITHAYLIKLPDINDLPIVKGSDDAEKAEWVPLSALSRGNMFEDHYSMIEKLLGI